MSTYLQLCRDVVQECGINNSASIPSAVTSQTGEMLRVVNWVKDSWTEIQNSKDSTWRWMRKSFTVSAASGDGAYAYTDCTDTVSLAAISRFTRWHPGSFKAYLTSGGVGGEYPLRWLPWEQFRSIYRYGTQTNSVPCHVSEDPTQAFVLGPIPSATYTVSGDYQIGPQILAADADTPEMPSRFHKAIVYRAMMKYGRYESAGEVYEDGRRESEKMMSDLRRDQLPALGVGGPLA